MTLAKRRKHPYYNFNKLLSMNGVLNVCAGGRGIGKTYGAKKLVIKKAIRTGEQFIYLRRYKTELAPSRASFFADITDEFPNHDFRVSGPRAEMSPVIVPALNDDGEPETESQYAARVKAREWVTIGFFVALSNAQTQKGVSFHNVTTIIFDEFIIEKGSLQYLNSEVDVLLNFYSTVDRYQEKTRVLMLSNSVSMMNPYFIEWKIRPDQLPELSVHNDGFVIVHFPDSNEFAKSVYQTRFGRFIKGSDYAEYAVANTFHDAVDNLVNEKNSNAKFQFILEVSHGSFSVWYDYKAKEYFIQRPLPRDGGRTYTMLPDKMSEDKILLTPTSKILQYIRTAYTQGDVLFDEPATRNTFSEIFTKR